MITEPRITKKQIADELGISRSTLYYRSKLHPKDEVLKEQILQILSINPAYGHRRIAIALNINRKRIRRVMKKYSIKPYKKRRKYRKRRDERRKESPYKNIIKGICPIVPNHIYVSDFTYIRYKESFIYLCTVMDLYTREIVGWNISTRHTKEFVLQAIHDAVERSGYQIPQIIHSDQGSEYTNGLYTKAMEYLGIQISMSKKGSPWENGYQESYYSNFKTELGIEYDRFESKGEIIEEIHRLINYYNRERIHLSLKMSPEQFKYKYYESFAYLDKSVR